MLQHAKHTPDATLRAREIDFARRQLDYILGSSGRSFLVGWFDNYPQFPHHAAASCPNMPAPCDWGAFSSPSPNPQVIRGGLVAGPGGVEFNPVDPDDSFCDQRSDYITNEVAIDYNAGFTTALAGLAQLL